MIVDEKTLVFITHRFDVHSVLRAILQQQWKNVVFVAANENQAEILRRGGHDCRSMQDYVDQQGENEFKKQTLEWIDQWADAASEGEKSVKEVAVYSGVSLWWFMLPVIFPDLLRCIQYVEATRAILNAEKPDRAVIVDVRRRKTHPFRLNHDDNLPGKIVAMTCQAEGVAIEFLEPIYRSSIAWAVKRLKAEIYGWAYYFLGKWFIEKLRKWLTGGKAEPVELDGEHPKVMIFSSPVYWRDSVGSDGRKIHDDAIAGACLRELGKYGYHIVGVDVEINTPNTRQFSVLRQKRRQQGIIWRSIECYAPGVSKRKKREQLSSLTSLAKKMGCTARLVESLDYKGIQLGEVMRSRFEFLFERYLPEAVGYLEAIEVAIEFEKPDLLMIVYEEGPYGRAATIAGHRQRVPTLALQHGSLSSPYTPAYYYNRVSTDVCADPISCPIPTCTAVYGEHTRKMLVEDSSYPEENVEVVGMPSCDPVIDSLHKFSKSEIKATLGLNDRQPLVLVISQPFFNQENRGFFIETVLDSAVIDSQHVNWIIKLHPSEEEIAWDSYIARRQLADNVRVFKSELHSLLFACDVVIAWFSTVILEASIFSKPVIALQLPGCWAPGEYVEDGLAISVTDADELSHALDGLLNNPEERRRLTDRSRTMLEKYIYRPDGHSAERIKDLVDKLIGQKRTANPPL